MAEASEEGLGSQWAVVPMMMISYSICRVWILPSHYQVYAYLQLLISYRHQTGNNCRSLYGHYFCFALQKKVLSKGTYLAKAWVFYRISFQELRLIGLHTSQVSTCATLLWHNDYTKLCRTWSVGIRAQKWKYAHTNTHRQRMTLS
jgi:hypothetical protein